MLWDGDQRLFIGEGLINGLGYFVYYMGRMQLGRVGMKGCPGEAGWDGEAEGQRGGRSGGSMGIHL